MSEQALYAPSKRCAGSSDLLSVVRRARRARAVSRAGFARTRGFAYRGARLDAQGRTELELTLDSDAETQALFPFAFTARLRVAFGQSLGLEFEVVNRGSQAFTYEEALHSYFAVSDVKDAAVRGLQGATLHGQIARHGGLHRGGGRASHQRRGPIACTTVWRLAKSSTRA